jgi:dTDP-4-dehydrorhamnose 3,5-epimerase-like enzyme
MCAAVRPARMPGMEPLNPARTRIEPVMTHRDPRGGVFEPLADFELAAQRNVHVVLTRPNEVRGNHAHRTAIETTSVVGPCLVRLKEADGIRDVEVPAGETWRFTIPPGVVHAYRNTGDTVMVLISFSTKLHDPADPETLREHIL